MEGLKVEEVKKGERIVNTDQYAKDEIKRVEDAIADATKRMMDLKHSKIITRDKMLKVNELACAISVGQKYLQRLKDKWGY